MPAEAEPGDEPARPRIAVADATPEKLCEILAKQPGGVLQYRDELAGWLNFDRYSGGKGERAFWLEAFGGGSYTVDRKSLKEPLYIPRLSVCVVGSIQPDRLVSSLLRAVAARAERDEYYRLRLSREIDDPVHQKLVRELDVLEAIPSPAQNRD